MLILCFKFLKKTLGSSMQQQISTNLEKWLTLSLTQKVGNVTMQKLLNSFGSIENIFDQNDGTLGQIININVARLILNNSARDEANAALNWLKSDEQNYILTIEDHLYPEELKQLFDYPHVLYLTGNINLLKNTKLAIVGTRHPSNQGIENATMFARELTKNNVTIVSGMATGIDQYAHIGALDGEASTIGVIGTGIDQIYPKSNTELFKQVIQKGLLISELPLGSGPLANNFPRRNRIIAALSKGCLVVESANDGGSMITANLALELGREVMAIPGSIHNPVARGCHKLIKTGAKLIETCNDILEELYIEPNNSGYNDAFATKDPVLVAMGYEPIEIDKICSTLDIAFGELCSKLLELELDGKITNCGNGKYQRIFR